MTSSAHPSHHPPCLVIFHIICLSRLILYDTAFHISSGIHGSSLVPSHLKLQDDFIGEQGLAALALGNFADEYEIEGDRQLQDVV